VASKVRVARAHAAPKERRRGRAGHVRRNQDHWDRDSRSYDRRFAPVLGGAKAMGWGLWRIPESRLRLLGPPRGRSILEVGCGAARWSRALAQRGARTVGLDLSQAQLHRAQELTPNGQRHLPLVHGSAEELPFRDGSFDIVFADWGATTFSDPRRTVPECARVLREGGAFVFVTAHPIRFLAFDPRRDRQTRRLTTSYFGMHRLDFGTTVEFQLPIGEWIDLFRSNGLIVERLMETRPDSGARTPYLAATDGRWARRWPVESLWKLRKWGEETTVSRPKPV
jgi:ubiquinone/menaquinone biosynthesis C-methylase UbiE